MDHTNRNTPPIAPFLAQAVNRFSAQGVRYQNESVGLLGNKIVTEREVGPSAFNQCQKDLSKALNQAFNQCQAQLSERERIHTVIPTNISFQQLSHLSSQCIELEGQCQARIIAELAQIEQLSHQETDTLKNVASLDTNKTALQTALRFWHTCQLLQLTLPMEVILRAALSDPETANKLLNLDCEDASDSAAFKRSSVPLLAQGLFEYVGMQGISAEAAKQLNTVHLWHTPNIIQQAQHIHDLDTLNKLLTGRRLTSQEVITVMTDNLITPDMEQMLRDYTAPDQLAALHKQQHTIQSSRNFDNLREYVQASREKGSEGEVIRLADAIDRMYSGQMSHEELQAKQGDITNALYFISENFLDRNPHLLSEDIDYLMQLIKNACPEADAGRRSHLIVLLNNWTILPQNQKRDLFSRLPSDRAAQLHKVICTLADNQLQHARHELQSAPELISLSVKMRALHSKFQESGTTEFNGKCRMATEFYKPLGVQPATRTSPTGHSGYEAVALLLGKSPNEVRLAAVNAARDMNTHLRSGMLNNPELSNDYRQRAINASENYQLLQSSDVQFRLKAPDDIANHLECNNIQNPSFWLDIEVMQYLAIAYGTAIIPLDFANPIHGETLNYYVDKYGVIKICHTAEDRKIAEKLIFSDKPKPLCLINLGDDFFPHWVPTNPQRKGRKQKQVPGPINPPPVLESLMSMRARNRRQLDSLMQNPQYLPPNQQYLQRPSTPDFSSTRHSQPSELSSHRMDPNLFLSLSSMSYSTDSIMAADSTETPFQKLVLTQAEQPERSPGFKTFRTRTCFANSSLKQLIISLETGDIDALRHKAVALQRNPSGIRLVTHPETGIKTFMSSHARAKVILQFANLAEATKRARCGEQVSSKDMDNILEELHQACYELSQTGDSASPQGRNFFPTGKDSDFIGRQGDAEEYMLWLLDIIDDDCKIFTLIQPCYINQATDNPNLISEKIDPGLLVIPINPDGRSITELLKTETEQAGEDIGFRFETDRAHPFERREMLGASNPAAIKRLTIQVKAFSLDPQMEVNRPTTQAAKQLVESSDFENITLELYDIKTKKIVPIKFRLKSVIVHETFAKHLGHYYTFEKSGNDWIKHDDNWVQKKDLKSAIQSNSALAPYLFSYERVD